MKTAFYSVIILFMIIPNGAFGREGTVKVRVPENQVAGSVPFELIRANRRPDHAPQIVFDDLSGWKLQVEGNADVKLQSSVERVIWHDRGAKLYYAGGISKAEGKETSIDKTTGQIVDQGDTAVSTTARLIPPEPVVIEDNFDTAAFWIFGGYYRRAESFDAVPPNLSVILEDADKQEYRLEFGSIISGNWTIETAYLPPSQAAKLTWPITVKAIEFTELDNEAYSELFMDSLAFYTRRRIPEIYDKMDYLNPHVLPSADATMMPSAPAGVSEDIRELSDGRVAFHAVRPAETLEYIVDPSRGMLNGITARWNEGTVFQPARSGALKIDFGDGEKKIVDQAKVLSAAVDENKYIVHWAISQGNVNVEWKTVYQLKGRTLAVDIECSGGRARGIDFGSVKGLADPKGILVPYMLLNRISHIYTEGPLIGSAEDVFVAVLPDWYQCRFSHFDNTPKEPGGDEIRLLNETYYYSMTDGTYNDLNERIIITVSPDFHDVLPNCVNQPSPNRKMLSEWVYLHAYFPHEHMFRTLREYGMKKILAGHHGTYLSSESYQGYSSFSNRWQSSESYPMPLWLDYYQKMKALGYGFSDYTFHPCVHPLNEFWDEKMLALRSNGSYARGWWFGTYAVKMPEAARLSRAVGMKVNEFYPTDCTYLDIHTVIGLSAMDYEAGIDGAGTALKTVYGNMDAIAETRKWHGSVIGEGYHRWLYAGISDADYASLFHRPSQHDSTSEMPLLVDFDLLKIHPLSHGLMMGCVPNVFFTQQDFNNMLDDTRSVPPIQFYMWVSASLAYGHMGMIGYDYLPPLSRQIQLYAMMLAPQREYLNDTVERIDYHDGERFVSVSQALKDNTLKVGRVHVRYSKGMDVYVNYNHSKTHWLVNVNGREYDLPPFGWVLTSPSGIHAYSAMINGHRVDYVKGPDYTYFFSPESPATQDGITIEGGVLINHGHAGWTLIPCGWLGPWEKFRHPEQPETFYDWKLSQVPPDRGCKKIRIEKSVFCLDPGEKARISAVNTQGKTHAVPVDSQQEHVIEFQPKPDVIKYLIN